MENIDLLHSIINKDKRLILSQFISLNYSDKNALYRLIEMIFETINENELSHSLINNLIDFKPKNKRKLKEIYIENFLMDHTLKYFIIENNLLLKNEISLIKKINVNLHDDILLIIFDHYKISTKKDIKVKLLNIYKKMNDYGYEMYTKLKIIEFLERMKMLPEELKLDRVFIQEKYNKYNEYKDLIPYLPNINHLFKDKVKFLNTIEQSNFSNNSKELFRILTEEFGRTI